MTVARLLSDRLNGRVLDNHSIYNVAFALMQFRTPEFYETVRAVRAVAYDRIAQIEKAVPVILTDVLTAGDWGQEICEAIQDLAARRGSRLIAVRLDCSLDENVRRAQSEARAYLGKLGEEAAIRTMRNDVQLIECGHSTLRLDSTSLTPSSVSDRILAELRHL